MSILAKKLKHLQNAKKQQLTENHKILNIKMSAKGVQFLHLAFQEGPSRPLPPVSHATDCTLYIFSFYMFSLHTSSTYWRYMCPGLVVHNRT